MYQASKKFGDAIAGSNRKFNTRLLENEKVLVESVKNFTITSGAEEITIGSAVASYVQATIENKGIALSGKEVSLEIGVEVDGEMEYIPMGLYTIQNPKIESNKVTFTAYDRLASRCNGAYYSKLSYPTDAVDILAEISTMTGVAIDTSTLQRGIQINQRAIIEEGDYNEETEESEVITTYVNPFDGYTYKETIGFIAGLFGKFAICGRTGMIEFRWYQGIDYEIPSNIFYNDLQETEESFSIKRLTCDNSDQTLSSGSGATGISMQNPVMTQSILDGVYNTVQGLVFTPAALRFIGDTRLDIGDIVTAVKNDGTKFTIPIISLITSYDGGLMQTIASYGNTAEEDDSDTKGPITEMAERVEYELAFVKKLMVDNLTATNATIKNLSGDVLKFKTGEFETLKTDVANFKQTFTDDLQASNAKINTLESDHATFKEATATNLNATNAKIANIEADYLKATDAKLTYATITNLNTTNAEITKLKTKDAEIDKLVATKATIADLNAAVGRVGVLESSYANLNTLVNGNLTSDNIQNLILTSKNTTIENGMIKNAMIENLSFDKITGMDINTTNLTVHSSDGKSKWSDNTIQISDANRVRVQIGKDASNDYSMSVWDKNGNLIWDALGATEKTIQRKIIRDGIVADDANISGSKLDINSVIEEVNGSTTKLKSSTIVMNDKNQTLDVVFNEMETTVADNLSSAKLYADGKLSDAQKYALEQANSALSSAKSYADSAVDNIEVGGRNLLVQKNITQGYLSTDGKGSFIGSGGGDQTSDWIDVSGNKYITITLYEDFTNANNSGRYCEYDADKNCINTVDYNPRQKSSIIIELKTTTKYIRVTAIECKTRRYKIEKGNKATDWTPAPEDTQSQIDNITEITTSHTTSISTMQGQISSLISEDTTIKGSYDALLSRYNATVATVDSIKTTIGEHTTILNNQNDSIIAVTTKANTIESNLAGTTQTISEVKSGLTGTQERVTKVETSLSGLITRVSSTETNLANLEIGGRNLLLYSQTIRAHKDYYGVGWLTDEVETFNGCPVWSVKNRWGRLIWLFKSHVIDRGLVKVGDTLTYSLYAKTNNASGKSINCSYRFKGNANAYWFNGSAFNVGTNWTRYSVTFTITKDMLATDTYMNEIGFEETASMSGDDKVYYTCPKLERGTKATDYTPASEDNEINGQNLVSNLSSNWEQGSVSYVANSTYASIKTVLATRLRTEDVFSVSGNVTISAGTSTNSSKEELNFYYVLFDVNKKAIGVPASGSEWQSLTSPKIINCGDAKYMAIILRWGSGSTVITPSDISQICLKIERGTSATPFTLAPEDVNGKIVNVETIANQTAKKFEWIVKGGDSSSNFTLTDRVADLVAERINFKGLVTFSGTTNLIENSNMMNGLANITSECKAIKVIDDSTYRKALVITPIAGGRIFWGVANVWKANITYTVSFVAKSSVAGQKIKPSRSVADWGDEITLTTSYVKYTTRIKSTATADGGTLSFSFSNAIGDVTLTNVKLETGMNPTDWSPAPGDYITQASLVRNWTTNTTWINGGKIYTGSITADKIATDAIKSRNYISSGGTQGSFLNLSDGSFQSPNLSWDANGNLIATNANLSGEITATKGSIAGWTIISDKMYTTGSGKYTGIGKYGSAYAFWAGATSNDNGNSAVFKVGHTGKLTATDADISGKITAINGTIGKYEITDTYLKTGSGSTCSGIGSDDCAFWAGGTNSKDSNFVVSYDGFVLVNNLMCNDRNSNDALAITNGALHIQSDNNSAFLSSTGFEFEWGGDYRILSVGDGVKCYHTMYATDFVADGWIYNASDGHYTWTDRNDAYISCGSYNNTNNIYYYAGYHAFYVNGDSGSGMMYIDTSGVSSRKGFRNSSDERIKKDFRHFDDDFIKSYMQLEPIKYRFKDDTDNSYHIGFKAQNVNSALNDYGKSHNEQFGICATHHIDPEYAEKTYGENNMTEVYTLAYDELIGANTFMIQKTRKDLIYQAGRIDMQEAIINDLQIRLLQAEKTIKQLTQALA